MFCAIQEFVQSQDCAAHSQNPEIACESQDCASAICERNGLTGWEHLSWLMEESWELSKMVMPWTGHSTGLGSVCARTQTEGKGVSLSWQTSQKPLVWGLEYTCLTLMVATELQELIMYVPYLHIRWKLEGFNCACNRNHAISRLCTGADWSRDCALVPRNLEIA